jgi:hypothetical protein
MRYLLTLVIDTRAEAATADAVEDAAYMACNEIAETYPGWFVDIVSGPDEAMGLAIRTAPHCYVAQPLAISAMSELGKKRVMTAAQPTPSMCVCGALKVAWPAAAPKGTPEAER